MSGPGRGPSHSTNTRCPSTPSRRPRAAAVDLSLTPKQRFRLVLEQKGLIGPPPTEGESSEEDEEEEEEEDESEWGEEEEEEPYDPYERGRVR